MRLTKGYKFSYIVDIWEYKEAFTGKIIVTYSAFCQDINTGADVKITIRYDPKLRILVGIETNPGPTKFRFMRNCGYERTFDHKCKKLI